MGNLLKTGKEINPLTVGVVIKHTKDILRTRSKVDKHEYNKFMHEYFKAVYNVMHKQRCNVGIGGYVTFIVAFETIKPKTGIRRKRKPVVEKNIKNNLT